MYSDRAAWESDFKACEQGIDTLAKAKGTVAGSPEALLGFLGLSDQLPSRWRKSPHMPHFSGTRTRARLSFRRCMTVP
jgi:hypothetical protein